MPKRLQYHFEPHRGWINDPNGLVCFRGQYHAFFQHNPAASVWGTMHWGHAVSDDLLNWEEFPVALAPDCWYEDDLGCFSGSAVEYEGRLYLFYTAVSKRLGQTQCMAFSDDGLHFQKYEHNPIIAAAPNGSTDFRDPKVTKFGDTYYMVVGSGCNGAGQVLFFRSDNLLHWTYAGVLLEGAQYGPVIECPDFFPLGGGALLMFSQMNRKRHSTMFIYGAFDGRRFSPKAEFTPQIGPHFYAPQTFLDKTGRRILIAWLYSWDLQPPSGAESAGALTIPMELRWANGQLLLFPVAEARHLLRESDPLVRIGNDFVALAVDCTPPLRWDGNVRRVDILRDTKTIEVFINGGEAAFSWWHG